MRKSGKEKTFLETEDLVNRYKVLFHDASPSMIEHLIRKLIEESQEVRVWKLRKIELGES